MLTEYYIYYIYYIYYSFWGLPFILRLSAFALIFFIPLYLLIIHIFIKCRNQYYRVRKVYKRFETSYGENLRYIVTTEKHLTATDFDTLLVPSVKKLSKRDKKIFGKLLFSISKDVPNFNYENNQKLLEYSKISKLLEKQLTHGSTKQKQDCLRRLDDLHTKVSGAILTGLTYSRNESLRKRSRSSYIRSTTNDSFRFFDENFDKNLNEWDKVDLHNALEDKFKKDKLPNLIRWVLRSDNLEFQCFMIDEVAYFNQQENAQVLMQLINEPEANSILRKHCIDALNRLDCKEIEPELLEMYSVQPQYVQDSIVRAIGKFKTGNALSFLIKTYENSVDDEKKLVILSAIYHYGDEGQEWFNTMKEVQNKDDFAYLLFLHVSNPLLSI